MNNNGCLASAIPDTHVVSTTREMITPPFPLPPDLRFNTRLKMDGLDFLSRLPDEAVPLAFLDPQYRGVLDKLAYGNEGVRRGQRRAALRQMDEATIAAFIQGIDRVLTASGHLFLWLDKFHLCSGFAPWLAGTRLSVVDMITWDKRRMGMGYRSRRQSEHLVVLQKAPRRARGVWTARDIPDVWRERVERGGHAHRKPLELQARLIAAVTVPGDVVIDPAAGSFSVLEACQQGGRRFLGCDVEG